MKNRRKLVNQKIRKLHKELNECSLAGLDMKIYVDKSMQQIAPRNANP